MNGEAVKHCRSSLIFLLCLCTLLGQIVESHLISCIDDKVSYCEDKPNGLRFYDGCRVCVCSQTASSCMLKQCRLSVTSYREAHHRCSRVERMNRILRRHFNLKNLPSSALKVPGNMISVKQRPLFLKTLLDQGNNSRFPRVRGLKNYKIHIQLDYKISRDRKTRSKYRMFHSAKSKRNQKVIMRRSKRSANSFDFATDYRSDSNPKLQRKLKSLMKRKRKLDKIMSKYKNKVNKRLRRRYQKISKQMHRLQRKLLDSGHYQGMSRGGRHRSDVTSDFNRGSSRFNKAKILFAKPKYSRYDNWSFYDTDEELMRRRNKKEIKRLTKKFKKLRRKYKLSNLKLNILRMRKEESFGNMNEKAEIRLIKEIKKYKFYCIHMHNKLNLMRKRIMRKAKESGFRTVIKMKSRKRRHQIIKKVFKRLRELRVKIVYNKLKLRRMIHNTRTKQFKKIPHDKARKYKAKIHRLILTTRLLMEKRGLYLSKVRPLLKKRRAAGHHRRVKRNAQYRKKRRHFSRKKVKAAKRRYKKLLRSYKKLISKRKSLKRRLLMYLRRSANYRRKIKGIRRKLRRKGPKRKAWQRSLNFYQKYVRSYNFKIIKIKRNMRTLNIRIAKRKKAVKRLRSVLRKVRRTVLSQYSLRKRRIILLKRRIRRYLKILHKNWRRRVFSVRKSKRIKAAKSIKIIRRKILKIAKRYHVIRLSLHPHSFNHFRMLRLAKWKKFILLRKERYIVKEMKKLRRIIKKERNTKRKNWHRRWLSYNIKRLRQVKRNLRKTQLKIRRLSKM